VVSAVASTPDWHVVSDKTRVLVADEYIVAVETSEFCLGKALDDAEQFWGSVIEQTTSWVTEDGAPFCESSTGLDTVTCMVSSHLRDEPTVRRNSG
jgi:hypothetical protein